MQHSKYFIEGQTAAHSGHIRAPRYNKEESRREWLAGFDSVARDFAVFKILPGVGAVKLADLDPVYIGGIKQCQDRAVTLHQADRAGRYVVYNLATGKPHQDSTKLNFKKV